MRAAFNREFGRTGLFAPELRRLYNDLFALRNEADYGSVPQLPADRMRPHLPEVRRFLERAEALLRPTTGTPEPDRF